MLLLEVVVDQQSVADAVTAYQTNEDVLLPLGELARVLTIAVSTDPARGTASGYVIEPTSTFELDVGKRSLWLGGKVEGLSEGTITVLQGDLYVPSRDIARWWPVDLQVDLSRLRLLVTPRKPLPVQLRLQRQARGGRAIQGIATATPSYPRQAIPYSLAGAPFVDQTLGVDYHRDEGGSAMQGAYSAYATGDLLGMEGALYVRSGWNTRSEDEARLTLGRSDLDARLLGPLKARSFQLGNVMLSGIENVSRTSANGDGVFVSNRPLSQSSSFGRHSLQGPLPPGWDVELFVNDVVTDFQSSGPDGQYQFDDLPLIFGTNEFRLVFHGPLGQVRVETETYLLEQSITRAGEFFYSVGQQRDEEGHVRSLARFDWGLGHHLAVTGGLTRLPLNGNVQQYLNLGLKTHFRSLIASLGRVDSGEGALTEVGIRTQLGDWSLNATHAMLDQFASEWYLPSGDPQQAATQVRLDGAVPVGSRMLPVSLEATQEQRQSGTRYVDVAGRVSARVRGGALTAQTRWQSYGRDKVANTTLQLSRRKGDVGLRGQVIYEFLPRNGVSSAALSVDKRVGEGYLANFDVSRQFGEAETRYSAGLSKSLGSFGLGVNAIYSTNGDVSAGVRLFLGLGRHPDGGGWLLDAQPLATTGAASARVFLDENLNRLMDEGESPIQGVEFMVNGGRHPVSTDPDGLAYLGRLPVMRPTQIGLISATLEDPQWLPVQEGAEVVPRPGAVARLDFPVLTTSEVEGVVEVVDGGQRRPLGQAIVELVDASGQVVAQTQSQSDGYYVVPKVPPGEYEVRVASAQLEVLGLKALSLRWVTTSPRDWLLSDVNLELTR